jgi:hypothetical protein
MVAVEGDIVNYIDRTWTPAISLQGRNVTARAAAISLAASFAEFPRYCGVGLVCCAV